MGSKNLQEHLRESKFQKMLEHKKALRDLIDNEIPSLMVVDGVVSSQYSIIPLYEVIDYWYNKKGGYTLEWETLFDMKDQFMVAWRLNHHSALGIRNMRYEGESIPCIYVISERRRELAYRRRKLRERDQNEAD